MGQNRTKIPSKTAFNTKKHNITKCSQTTYLRHLRALNLAGAVRIELTTRGFGVMVGVFCIIQHRLASCEKARKIGIFGHSTFYIVECFFVSFSNF